MPRMTFKDKIALMVLMNCLIGIFTITTVNHFNLVDKNSFSDFCWTMGIMFICCFIINMVIGKGIEDKDD